MSENPYFQLQGVSHLALVCGDMARTVSFYENVLGMPLMKTMEIPGGQHFFFDCGNDDCLAFFWWADGVPAAPGVAFPSELANQSADGSMHHVAFKIPPDQVKDCAQRLAEHGVKYQFIAHKLPETIPEITPEQLAAIQANPESHTMSLDDIDDDTFAASFYFKDPDGMIIEFCAWLPAWDKVVREHEPLSRGATSLASR